MAKKHVISPFSLKFYHTIKFFFNIYLFPFPCLILVYITISVRSISGYNSFTIKLTTSASSSLPIPL